MVKLVIMADLHANKERKEKCLKVLDKVKDIAKEQEADAVLFAGDFWDSTITNTQASGFVDFVNAVGKICEVTKLVMIAGTPSHEPDGSLDVFSSVGANVCNDLKALDIAGKASNGVKEAVRLLCIPEPRKQDYIASKDPIKKMTYRVTQFLKESHAPKNNVILFHGNVSGATYTNGQRCEGNDSFMLTKKMVQEANAIYTACGHIHKRQTVFKDCVYCGSCPPKNFDETHDAGVMAVSIENNQVLASTFISLKLPKKVTIELDIKDIKDEKAIATHKECKGNDVLCKLHITKGDKKALNPSKISTLIKDVTGAFSVKMQFMLEENISKRAKELRELNSVEDKIKLWGTLYDVKIKDGVLSKLKEIDDNLIEELRTPCDNFELMSISLRGAIGIKDGTGKDQIDIDFSQYDDGVVALCGHNGCGKTTLIENCHPFPQMLTRSGILKEHFCLKHSHRILVYRSSSGKYIRITFKIDGTAKNIMTQYFVEASEDGLSWQIVKSCDGSRDKYDEFVKETFGSVSMFLRTSFFAKEQVKALPDLSHATKGEKMLLFSTLVGLDRLRKIQSDAKDLRKAKEDEAKQKINSIGTLNSLSAHYDELKERACNNDKELALIQGALQEARVKMASLEVQQKAYDEAAMKKVMLDTKAQEKETTLLSMRSKLQKDEDDYIMMKEEAGKISEYKKLLSWGEKANQRLSVLSQRQSDIVKELYKILPKYNEEISRQTSAELKKREAESQCSRLKKEYEALVSSTQTKDNYCPYCGTLLSNKKANELRSRSLKSAKELAHEIEELEEKALAIKIDTSIAKKLKERTDALKKEQSKLNEEEQGLKIQVYDANLSQAQLVVTEYEPRIKELQVSLPKLRVDCDELEAEVAKLREEAQCLPEDVSQEISFLKDDMDETQRRIAELLAENKVISREVSSLDKQMEAVKTAKEDAKKCEEDALEYGVIERAFGNDGIQALELDNAAPEISDIANQILKETFGDRFTLSFETQRSTKDGRKIDDFIINIFDCESARNKKLDFLSSGEGILVKQALFFAFSVVCNRKTGFSFKVRFLDETDGSLDSQTRSNYLKMIEAAHRLCGIRLTILVSHSKEVLDTALMKIEL